MKEKFILILVVLTIFLISGCIYPERMIIEEAVEIAQNSECVEKGRLTEEYMYNEHTKTWWINLDMKEEFKKEFCNPACVVKEDTKTAVINWRCMGLVSKTNSVD